MVPQDVVRYGHERGIVVFTQLAEAVDIARLSGFNQFLLRFDPAYSDRALLALQLYYCLVLAQK